MTILCIFCVCSLVIAVSLPALSESLHLRLARTPVFLLVVTVGQFGILICTACAEDPLIPVIRLIVNHQLRGSFASFIIL